MTTLSISKVSGSSKVTEIHEVGKRMNVYYLKGNWENDPYLQGTFTVLGSTVSSLSKAIKQDKAHSELEKMSKDLDKGVRTIYYLIEGPLRCNTNDALKEAAEPLKKTFNKYGLSVCKEGFTIKSAYISSLCNDLLATENLEKVKLITALEDEINRLKGMVDDFTTRHVNFEEQKAKEKHIEPATVYGRKLKALINDKVVVHLRAMLNSNYESYGTFCETIAMIIEDNNVVVKQRSKRIRNKKKVAEKAVEQEVEKPDSED